MHQRFKKEFEDLDLSFSLVEQKIGCPKNYLSRFINGGAALPSKWERPIDAFISALKKNVEKIEATPPNLEILKPWIVQIEAYCKTIGKDPEELIEEHKELVAFRKSYKPSTNGEIKIQDLTEAHPKSNYTINTMPLSNWAEENRKKKLGIK